MTKKELTKAVVTHRENMLYHLKGAYDAEANGSHESAERNIGLAAQHAALFTALSLLNKS